MRYIHKLDVIHIEHTDWKRCRYMCERLQNWDTSVDIGSKHYISQLTQRFMVPDLLREKKRFKSWCLLILCSTVIHWQQIGNVEFQASSQMSHAESLTCTGTLILETTELEKKEHKKKLPKYWFMNFCIKAAVVLLKSLVSKNWLV